MSESKEKNEPKKIEENSNNPDDEKRDFKLTEAELREYDEIDHFFEGEKYKREKRIFPSLRSKF